VAERQGDLVRLHESIYPRTAAALFNIALDNGMVNRVDGDPRPFKIPRYWVPALARIENALGALSDEDLDTFTTGEHDEMNEIASRHPDLKVAHKLMDDYFEDWPMWAWEVRAIIDANTTKEVPHA
jgi:hypothetical protein